MGPKACFIYCMLLNLVQEPKIQHESFPAVTTSLVPSIPALAVLKSPKIRGASLDV